MNVFIEFLPSSNPDKDILYLKLAVSRVAEGREKTEIVQKHQKKREYMVERDKKIFFHFTANKRKNPD